MVDPLKRVELVIPDLTGFKVRIRSLCILIEGLFFVSAAALTHSLSVSLTRNDFILTAKAVRRERRLPISSRGTAESDAELSSPAVT